MASNSYKERLKLMPPTTMENWKQQRILIPIRMKTSIVLEENLMREQAQMPDRRKRCVGLTDTIIILLIEVCLLLPLYILTFTLLTRLRTAATSSNELIIYDLAIFAFVAANILLDICLLLASMLLLCCPYWVFKNSTCRRFIDSVFHGANSTQKLSLHTLHAILFVLGLTVYTTVIVIRLMMTSSSKSYIRMSVEDMDRMDNEYSELWHTLLYVACVWGVWIVSLLRLCALDTNKVIDFYIPDCTLVAPV